MWFVVVFVVFVQFVEVVQFVFVVVFKFFEVVQFVEVVFGFLGVVQCIKFVFPWKLVLLLGKRRRIAGVLRAAEPTRRLPQRQHAGQRAARYRG
jgi:hypothetical protein